MNDTTPLMTVDDLIQSMRTGTLADVRKRLEKLRKKNTASYNTICRFYNVELDQILEGTHVSQELPPL